MHKIYFVSLGCDKNLVDSEYMLGCLAERNYEMTDDPGKAEVIIVNTCAFIKDALEESTVTLLEMARYKQCGVCRALIVCGCLSQRYQKDICQEIPEVDAVLGTGSYGKIADTADRILSGEKDIQIFDDPDLEKPVPVPRVLTNGGFVSYLKIADGCDKRCTYCIIPFLRGHYRSYDEDFLVRQAADLAARGVKELILVAQETTVYGLDNYGEKKLPDLLKRLCRIDGLTWIRLLYCYPEEITPELINVIRDEPKICHYLDLPVQHASDRILRKMGRRTTGAELRRMIASLREKIPDIALRTTLMTGFPGETEQDHEILMDFVREMRFDRLGVFTYSREDGTAASEMPDQIEESVKEKRKEDLMLLQQQIAFEIAESQEGKIYSVFVEGRVPEDEIYVGRTYRDAPDVDGLVFFTSDADLMSGDLVQVRITGARDYDLTGVMIDEPED